ncbi:UNVERIFIED_CONTAM: Stemmadenine O-acetyltransferase [Sesamum latifolium]|uniref:Stemmadenine O-acetyltransferase n=1 Tax=Sesamum latifolium TaxID=2727402 RepID=A0AAW2X0D2_9LAMI
MEIKIEVISQEIIKPSSPTPEPLRKYRLSFLDQIVAPPDFIPGVYFYQADAKFSNLGKSNNLKKSLSQVLSRFYPLAGRLVDNLYVNCNDEGAPYIEAVANCSLPQVITNPVMNNIAKFLPYKVDDVQDIGMAVQVTYFQCGGTAVGLVISHKMGDGLSFLQVANTWAAVARNGNYDDVPHPKFEGAKTFPPRDALRFNPSTDTREELVSKIFIFPDSKISALQERYSSEASEFLQRPPSRVEALSAFIWTRFISATEMKANPNKIYTVHHTVNLRPRLDPPLSDQYHFGNIFWMAVAAMPSVGANCGSELMQKVKEAIRAVNRECVAQLLQGDIEYLNFLKERMGQANRSELVRFTFTSMCKFPLYKADFGWGKPVWVVTLAGILHKNLVVFTDTATGDGIEARINLRKEDMEKFEADLELQEFLSNAKTFGIHNSRL